MKLAAPIAGLPARGIIRRCEALCANASQRRPTPANAANAGQRRANAGQRQPQPATVCHSLRQRQPDHLLFSLVCFTAFRR